MKRVLPSLAAVAALLCLLASGAAAAEDIFSPQLGLPATEVVAFGSSLGQSSGESWAYGRLGPTPTYIGGRAYSRQYALLEHSEPPPNSDVQPPWQVVPLPEGPEGKPLAGELEKEASPEIYGALAGQATQDGGVVLLSGQHVVIRDPEGKLSLVPAPKSASESGVLDPGESLLPPAPPSASQALTVPYAAIEEGAGTGMLIAPHEDGGKQSSGRPESQPGVLHYDREGWSREPVQVEGEALEHFTALALACGGSQADPEASSPEDCWLLAGYGHSEIEHLALYRRVRSSDPSGWSWRPQPVDDWLLGEETPRSANGTTISSVRVGPLPPGAQMLTATDQGVWVDFAAYLNGETHATDVTELVFAPQSGSAASKVAGHWCYPAGVVCSKEESLEAALPTSYRSFAWPGSPSEAAVTRVITGLPGRAMLELSKGSFAYTPGAGGGGGYGNGGAALHRSAGKAVEGWIATGVLANEAGSDGEGQSQAIDLTEHSEPNQLQEEAVPFRQPLLAVAQAPGTTPGDPNAEAFAVGVDGEVARYLPGEGWEPEGLYNAEGKPVQASHGEGPVLRGVAWPESKRAYAVGDEGAMWVWQKEVGYWVPDPGRPFNFFDSLNAIAFSSRDPQIGFAVGKEGALLKYGKSWEEIAKQTVKTEAQRLERELGFEEWRLNFTSVAFAGSEALASYRDIASNQEAGGLLVYDEESVCVREDEQVEARTHRALPTSERACWHTEPSATALLDQQQSSVLSKVAGLPEGGAVAAGPDAVLEQESPGAPWHLSQAPLAEAESISALAAYREAGGPVRAIVSVDLDPELRPFIDSDNSPWEQDIPAPTGPGEPPPLIGPDPLPDSGYVVKETAEGWRDMEHEAFPVQASQKDMPLRPEPVFALLVEPSGRQGLAVGGQTYNSNGRGSDGEAETAGAMRFPSAAEQPVAEAGLSAPRGQTSFLAGGLSECNEECYDLSNEHIGPEVWFKHALQTAGRIAGARAFMYTGGWTVGASGGRAGEETFRRELGHFKELIDETEGAPPVYVAATANLEPSGPDGSLFEGIEPTEGKADGDGAEDLRRLAGTGAYALTSTGSQGTPVRIIMLDYSRNTLEFSAGGESEAAWLKEELKAAAGAPEPVIVMGSDPLGFNIPYRTGDTSGEAEDAASVSCILTETGASASAYVFGYSGVNVKTEVTCPGHKAIAAFGTGTLGGNPADVYDSRETLYSSGFLLLSVNPGKPLGSNAFEVTASVIPNAGRLAIHSVGGTLLRRSTATVMEGLARRPPAGMVIERQTSDESSAVPYPSLYDPIPADCQGSACADEVPLQYTFTSSKPDVGGFVLHEAASANELQVQFGPNHKPIPDEPRNAHGEPTLGGLFEENSKGEPVNERGEVVPRAQSGLFCAYNEGTTTITISAGGLSYSMPITVRGGSVEYPCGTVPLKNPPTIYEHSIAPIPISGLPQPAPGPLSPQIQNLIPPPAPVKSLPHLGHHVVYAAPIVPAALVGIPPLPLATSPATPQPTPPSGTAQVPAQSPVSQTVGATEREEEVEGAYQHVHNMAAYERPEGESTPIWPLALILIAAAAGAGLRPGRDREGPVYAWARGWRKDP